MQVLEKDWPGPLTTHVGAAQLWDVEEIAHHRPLADMTTDAALIASLPEWLARDWIHADATFDIVSRSWILVHEGRVVVVDPCTGNHRDYPEFTPAHQLDTPYIDRFSATGIRPEEVDFVFCTHLHMDHCGWNTTLRDGRFVPTFPNARYVMVRREFDRWDPRRSDHLAVPANYGTFENSVLPVLEAGLADIVEDRHAIMAGLTVEPAYGHTFGHSLLHLVSDGHEALFTGDVFHHPLEIWMPGLDDNTSEDFATLHTTRKRIIQRCLDTGALMLPAHFRSPFGGYVRQGENGVVFYACPAQAQETQGSN